MTTWPNYNRKNIAVVVEAYRLDRYDNLKQLNIGLVGSVVEAYRLDRYDNLKQ